MIRRSHRDSAKSAARTARIREKAYLMRNQVRKSAESFVMRYQARMAWWSRTFRTPSLGLLHWATGQAKTLWAAFMAILGLSPKGWGKGSSRRAPAVRQSYFRTALCEGLEERKLLAVDIFTNDSNLQEGGPVQNGQFFLTRSGNVGNEVVTLAFDTTSGFANTENADFVATAASVKIYEFGKPSLLNVTIPAGSTSLVIDIDAIDDNLYDGGTETVKVALITSSSEAIGLKTNAQIGIIDNETAPTIRIVASDASATENAGGTDPGEFTVEYVGSPSDKAAVVNMTYTVPGNTVTTASSADYNSAGSATIPAGSQSTVVAVTINDDNLVEATETIKAKITLASANPLIVVGSSDTDVITIADTPDTAKVSIGPFVAATVSETGGVATAKISQTQASSSPTVVKYSLITGTTATEGTDFTFGLVSEIEANDSVFGPQQFASGAQGLAGFSLNNDSEIANSTTVPHLTVNSTTGTNNGTADVYAFYTSTGGASVFDIDTTTGGFNSFLEVFDGNGTLLGSNDNLFEGSGSGSGGGPNTTDSQVSVNLPSAGIYYVRVTAGTAGSSANSAGASAGANTGATGAQSYRLHLSVPGAQNYGVIGAGSTNVPLIMSAIGDSLVEPDEDIKVRLDSIPLADSDISFQSGTATDASRNAAVTILDDDNAKITVTSTKAVEPGTNGVFTFTQSLKSSSNTVVEVVVDNINSTTKSLFNGSVSDPADHTLAQTLTVTIAANTTQTTLTVPVIDSALIEEDETLVVKLATKTTTDPQITLAAPTASMLFQDEDLGVVDVDATFSPAVEGVSNGKFTFFLAEPPGYPIGKLTTSDRDTVIEYTISGSATPGVDFAPLTGTATIPAFASSTDVIIDVMGAFNDLELEANETVIISITKLLTPTDSNISVGVGSPTDQLVIVDNDSLTVSVSKTLDAFEGGAKGVFTFETVGTGITVVPTVVTYKVNALSSAVEGVDFGFLTGTVTIPAGAAPQSATVEIDATGAFDDGLFEGNETVFIEIVSVSGGPGVTGSGNAVGNIIDDESGTVTITKVDDAAEGNTNGKFQITLGGQSPLPTVVEYSVLTGNINDATPGSDYVALGPTGKVTFAPFQTSTTLLVDVMDDGISEGTETVRVQVTKVLSGIGYTPAGGPATVNIFSDQEVELSVVDSVATETPLNNDSASFAVKLYSPSAGIYTSSETPTVVTYQVLTGNADDATAGSDYPALTGTVTIAANQTSAVITVAATDDNLIEETEKVRIKLLSVSSGAGDITISKSLDQGFVSINDNDAGYVSVKATKSPAQDNPASDVDGEFTFFLSQPSATNTVVTYSIAGTATSGAGNDYATLSGTVTIPANSTSATVLVDVFNDNIVEGTETVKVTMTAITSGDPQIKLGSLGGPSLKFQQGLGTYNSSEDTFISLAFPTVNFDGGAIQVDTDSLPVPSSAAEHGLLKFGGIIGPSAIPLGAPIQNAVLSLTTTIGGPVSLHELFGGWSEGTATWNTVFGGNGIQPDGLESSASGPLAILPSFSTTPVNVTSNVQSWSSGNPNFGWAILPNNPLIGTKIVSSEGLFGARPYLTVDLDLSATVEIVDTDTATVQVFGTSDAVEPGIQGKFMIVMTNPSSSAVTVYYEDLLTGTAVSGSDYVPVPSGSIVIPANATNATVFITPNNDSLIEFPETVNLKITKIVTADPEITLGSPVTGTVTINDNDFGVISFGAVVNGDENTMGNTKLSPINGTAVINLTVPSDTDTVLALSVTGTATAGSDYNALPALVTIPANFLSTTITIEVIDDGINEAAGESVILKLDSIVSGNPSIFGTPTSKTVLILDDEQVLEVNNVATIKNAVEGTTNGEFQFQLNFPSDKPTVITYQVINPAGGAGLAALAVDGKAPDYNGSALTGSVGPTYVTGTVTIPANSTSVSLPVVPFLDYVTEGPETVQLQITSVSNGNGVLNATPNAFVTINDLEYKVAVTKTDSPGAEPGPAAGSNAQFTFTLTNPLPEPTVVTYSVVPGAGLFISPAFDPDTNLPDVGPLSGTLTIPANTTQFTLSVDVIDDLKLEGDETLTLQITGASTAGPSYKWGPAPVPTIDSTPATQVVVDNDTTTVSVSGVDGTESGQPLALSDGKFVISQGNVSATDTVVKYKILASSTATSGSDYSTISTTLATIPAGQLSTWVTVDVQQDNLLEPTETVNIQLLSLEGPTDPSAKLGTTLGTVNITDDDTSTAFLIPTSPIGFEPGTNDGVFTVFLTNPSSTNTVVTFSLDPSGDATPGLGNDYQLLDKLAGTTLAIPVGSVTVPAGQTSTTIIVDVLDDNIIENDETVKIKLSSTSNAKITADTTLKTVTIQDLTGFSVDQDTAKVVVSKLVDGDENKAGLPIDGKFLLTLVPTNPNYNPLNGKFYSDENTVVEYVVQGSSTATNGSDFNLAVTGTVTISAGDTTAILTVPVLEDNLAEFTETVDIKLTSIKGVHVAAISADSTPATVSILDDDASVLTISSPTVVETDSGTVAMKFLVTSPTAVAGGFSVSFAVADVTTNKSGPSDYSVATSSPLAFTGIAGETQFIVIDVNGDTLVEATETLKVTLTSATPGSPLVIAGAVGTGTITNDDKAVFTIADVTVVEDTDKTSPSGDGSPAFVEMEFEVKVSNPIDVATDIDINFTDLTAVGGDFDSFLNIAKPVPVPQLVGGIDYDNDAANGGVGAYNSKVTFSANSTTSQKFRVRVNNDSIVEGGLLNSFGNEQFEVTMVDKTGTRNTDVNDKAIGTITDDDVATVSLVTNDPLASEPFDTVNEGNGQFTVVQTAVSSSPTIISYTVGGSASPGSDYKALTGVVTIPAGATSAFIDVTVVDSAELEDDETVVVTLTKITSGDPDVTLTGTLAGTVTIYDDDQALVTLKANDPNASEDPLDDGQFTVSLSEVSDTNTVVTYSIAAGVGQATNGADYKALSGTVTIPAGQTETKIDVSVLQDVAVESAETVTLTLTGLLSPTNADIKIGGANNDTVTIADDSDGILVSVFNNGNGTEGVSNGSFIIKITKDDGVTPVPAPPLGLTVNYSSAGGTATAGPSGDYVALSGSIFIPPGQTTGLIDVSVNDDLLVEATETVKVGLVGLVHSGFPGMEPASIGVGNAAVDIIDNDKAVFTVEDLVVNEGDGSATIKVSISSKLEGISVPVTVNYTPLTAGSPSDFAPSGSQTVVFGPGSLAPQSVTFTIVDDLLVEGLEGFGVSLSTTYVNGPGLHVVDTTDVAVVGILDNDFQVFNVQGVKAGSSAWSATFNDFVDNTGAPVGQRGFSIPAGAAQATTLPWANINRLFVNFSQDPDPATLTPANFVLFGLQGAATPSVTSVAYDTSTNIATLTLSGNITNDRLRLLVSDSVTYLGTPLDGEWANNADSFDSGNGTPGGAFNFTFNVLPGDVDRFSTVNIADASLAFGAIGASTDGTNAFPAPNTSPYTIFKDVDGSGTVNIADAAITFGRLSLPLNSLPVGSPGSFGTGNTGAGDYEKEAVLRSLKSQLGDWAPSPIEMAPYEPDVTGIDEAMESFDELDLVLGDGEFLSGNSGESL
ncbi:Calx-beta domain protein [Pirellula sp. SH-Sr6A]|uniref:beta strand repeat-containing protein n=1 Tax=Pirellula sp. SH-Sr6A TaxID=1632865 RepID=UPI00078D43C0|nr:Calx-beta domain-containing protein [Pirellula sp. SH-Sr6A]AMV30637.1 Calx-beta domain protein [Pirellula sp. SH-Sr6A]